MTNQVLDCDKKSHLTPEELKDFLTSEGEPFQQVKLASLEFNDVQKFACTTNHQVKILQKSLMVDGPSSLY